MKRWVFVFCFGLVGVGVVDVDAQPEGRVFLNTPDTVAIWEFNNLGMPGDLVTNGTVVPDLSGNGRDAVVENAGSNLTIGLGDENFGDTDTTLVTTAQGPRVVADYPDAFTFDETESFTMELYVQRDETAGNQAWGMLAGTWHSRTANGDACAGDCSFECRNTEGAWYGWGLMRLGDDNESYTFNLSPINPDGTLNSRGCCNERHPGAVVEFPRGEFSYFVASIDREEQVAHYYLSTLEGGTAEVGTVNLSDTWSFITPDGHDTQRFVMFSGEDDRSCNSYRAAPNGYHLNAVRIQNAAMSFLDVEDAWFSIQDGEATPPSEGDGCQAVLSLSKSQALTGECVELSAANSTVEGGTIEKYEWKIGDGDFTEGESKLEMTFDTPTGAGGMEVQLRITSSGGCESTARSTLTVVLPAVAAEILASDGAEPLLGSQVRARVGAVLTLDSGASGTVVPFGRYACPLADQTPLEPIPVASYSWDLNGDGTPESTEPTFDTPPLQEGSLEVVLTVTNEAGTAGTARLGVTVLPQRRLAERIFGETPDTIGIWEFNNLLDEGLGIGEPLPNDFTIPDLSGNGLDAVVEGNDAGTLVVAEGDREFSGESGDNLMVTKSAGGGPPRVVVNDEEAFTYDEFQSFTMELYVHRAENDGNEAWGMLAGTWHSRNTGGDTCIDNQGNEDCSWDCRNTNGVWYGWGLMRHSGDNDAFTFNLSPLPPDGMPTGTGCCNEQNPGPAIRFEPGYNYFAATIDREAQQARYYLNGMQVGSVTLQPAWSFITPEDHDAQRLAFFTYEQDRSCAAYGGGPSGYSIDAARMRTAAVTTEEVEQTWSDIFNGRTSPAPEGPVGASLKPGDVNGDGGYNISDPVAQLNFLFASEAIPDCYVVAGADPVELTPSGLAILDFNGDGGGNIADAVASLNFLFGGGEAPALGEGCADIEGDCVSNCQ